MTNVTYVQKKIALGNKSDFLIFWVKSYY